MPDKIVREDTVNLRQQYSRAYEDECVFAYTNVMRDDSTNSNFGWNYVSLGGIMDIKQHVYPKVMEYQESYLGISPLSMLPYCDVLVVIEYFGGHKAEHHMLEEVARQLVDTWLTTKGAKMDSVESRELESFGAVASSYRTTRVLERSE